MRTLFRLVLEAAMMFVFVLFFMALRNALDSLHKRQVAAGLNRQTDFFAEQECTSDRSPAFLRRSNSN